MELRPYQREAIDALERDWGSGLQRLGCSAATGTGKTVIFSHLAHRYVQRGERVLIMVHRDELVQQTMRKLRAIDDRHTVGVVKGAENNASSSIVIASVQTITRPNRLARIGRYGLVIVDEAHRSMSDQWMRPLVALGTTTEGGPRVAGFSATWTRADDRQLGDYWEKISFELPIRWAINEGFLVRPIGKYIRTDIRLDTIKKTAGDFNDRDIGKKLSRDTIRDAIVSGYKEFASDRSGVVFCPTVETAEYYCAGFQAAGFTAAGLYGITSKEESQRIHKAHASGDIQVLLSCTRLSEGWDAPHCSAAVIARPTTHEGLFIQQVGRVLRPYEGKRDAIILDPTGVLFLHSLDGCVDLTTSDIPDEVVEKRQRDDDEWALRGDAPTYDGDVSGYQDIDLLAGSGVRWLRTRSGIRFVYAHGKLAFLVPGNEDSEQWQVGVCRADSVTDGSWLANDLSQDDAVSLAEQWAMDTDPVHVRAKAAWRRRPATYAQRQAMINMIGQAARLSGLRKQGEVYDAMARQLASRTLDPVESWL